MAYPTNTVLAARLRVDADDAALPGIAAAAQAYIDNVQTKGLPEAIRNEAYIRLCAYLFDAPSTTNFYNAFKSSGAAALLAPWTEHQAGTIGEAESTGTATPRSGTTLTGTQIVTLINAALGSTDWQSSGDGVDLSQIADWAEVDNTDLIPADKYRAPTSTERGAPFGVTNNDVDEGNGARVTTFLSFTVNHLKRLINRVVPAWARAANPPVTAAQVARIPTTTLPSFPTYLDGDNLPWTDRIYTERALVTHNGATYLCKATTQGQTKAVTEPGVGSDWGTYWALLGHATVAASNADQTARTQAMQAAAKALANESQITALQAITRDLHSPGGVATWATAQDGLIIRVSNAANPEQQSYSVATLNKPADGWTAAFTIARVPFNADISRYRLDIAGTGDEAGENLYYGGNAWRKVTPENHTAHDFYIVRYPGEGVAENQPYGDGVGSVILQKQSNPGLTLYDGQLGPEIVKLNALADAVAARLLPTGGGDGKFVGHASGSPAWVDAPSGGGSDTFTEVWNETGSQNLPAFHELTEAEWDSIRTAKRIVFNFSRRNTYADGVYSETIELDYLRRCQSRIPGWSDAAEWTLRGNNGGTGHLIGRTNGARLYRPTGDMRFVCAYIVT